MNLRFQNPNNGEVLEVESQLDEASGKDLAREKAVAKGYIPVVDVLNPKTGDRYTIDDRTLDKATAKGYTVAPAESNSPKSEAPSAEDEASDIIATPEGAWTLEQITDEELAEISRRTGTDVAKLKAALPYFTGGVPMKGQDQTVGGVAAGVAGRMGRVAASLPQAVYKKLVADDKDERALDILDVLARKKQSYMAATYDVLGGIGLAKNLYKGVVEAVKASGSAVPKALPFIASGPLAGAAAGVGLSEKGKELEDAAVGGAIGSALTVAPQAAGAVMDLAKKYVAGPVSRVIQDSLRKNQKALEEVFQDFAAQNKGRISTVATGLATTNLDSFGKFIAEVKPEFASELLTSSKPIPKKLVEKFAKKLNDPKATEEQIRTYLAAKQLDKQFKTQFGTSIRQIQGRVQPGQFEEMYKDLLRKDIYAQTINPVTNSWSTAKKFAYAGLAYLTASKPTAMLIDDLYGTNAERILDDMGINYNLKYANPIQRIADTVYKSASKAADIPDAGKRILAGDESVELAPIREYFDKVRGIANDLGAAIPKAENYFPKMKLPAAELTLALRKEFDGLISQLDIAKADPKQFKELLKSVPKVEELTSIASDLADVKIADGQQLINTITGLLNNPREIRTGINKVLSASLAAGEKEIPDWARDWNTRRVMSRWANNTFKSLAYGDGIRKLRILEETMDRAGDTTAAKFFKDMRADLLGGKPGTMSNAVQDMLQRREERLVELAEKATNPISRAYYNTAKDLPQFGNWFKNWTYATLLGGRAKPALQNITSAYLQNAGDIGYARAQRYLAEAGADMVDMLTSGKILQHVREEVYDRGLVAPGWRGEMDALVSGKPTKGKLAKGLGYVDQGARDLVTSVFTMSEITARALTAGMGKRLAKDMLEDPKLQRQFIQSLPSPSYQRSIARALQSGELRSVEDEVIRYMNATNMFNYHTFNQSQFVRDMGPAFSMFTLWPSMALGRVAKDFVTSGGTKASARLAATIGVPWAALFAADLALRGTSAKETPAYKLALGESGLADQTLLSAFPTNIQGRSGLVNAPIPNTVAQGVAALSGLLAQDPKEAAKLGREVSKTYVPYMSILNKFFNEQLPLWQGKLPEK
jgi:hypothetical protein